MTTPSRRTAMDVTEVFRPSPEEQLEGLGLFEQPKERPRWASAGEDDEARLVELLAAIAKELAEKAGPYNPVTRMGGITMADVRLTAQARGILTGEERGRRLSFLGRVAKAAGLEGTGEFRRSSVDKSHGNPHIVWTLRPGAMERAG